MINYALEKRLERYKANANSHLENALKLPNVHPDYIKNAGDWRKNRYPKPAILKGPKIASIRHGQDDYKTVYADCFEDLPFKLEGDASDYGRDIPYGWYTDDLEHDILKGAVLSFRHPHRINPEDESHVFYIAGTYHSEWDGVTVYPYELHETPTRAAYSANRYAERDAEIEREANEQYRREQEAEEAREEIHSINKDLLPLIKEIKSQTVTPKICEAMKQHISRRLRHRKEQFKIIQARA